MNYDTNPYWNRCDQCGRFIAYADFDKGARRVMVAPDSDWSREDWETLCIECNRPTEHKIEISEVELKNHGPLIRIICGRRDLVWSCPVCHEVRNKENVESGNEKCPHCSGEEWSKLLSKFVVAER